MTPNVEQIKFTEIFPLFAKQKLALEATKNYKYTLYGGSMGSGKSYFLRAAAVYWLLRLHAQYGVTGVTAALFCESYPALRDRHLKKIKSEYPDWLGSYNEQNHEFTLSKAYGSGVVAFRNLDDASKYLSAEFAFEAVDEVSMNPLATFQILKTRLRWSGIPDKDLKFVAASNPIGEPWVKQYFVDRLFPPEENAQDYCFVQALPNDNPHLPAEYFNRLATLPEAERKAFLEGDWNAFEGEMDSDGWLRLLSATELANAQTDVPVHVGVSVLAVDPGAGGDESALVLRSETEAEVLYNQKLSDTMALIPLIGQYAARADRIAIDVGGLGKPIYDRLLELHYDNVVPVNFGSKASDSTRYQNRKAELYDKARTWVLHGGKLKRDTAWNELSAVKYKIDSDRTIAIQSKQELLRKGVRSPNVADALAISLAVDPAETRAEEQFIEQAYQDEWFPKPPEYGYVQQKPTKL